MRSDRVRHDVARGLPKRPSFHIARAKRRVHPIRDVFHRVAPREQILFHVHRHVLIRLRRGDCVQEDDKVQGDAAAVRGEPARGLLRLRLRDHRIRDVIPSAELVDEPNAAAREEHAAGAA